MLKKIGRILIVVMAVFVIVLSVGGIVGAWGISSAVSNVTLKVFSVVQAGAEVVDTAAGRMDTLVQTARSEVQQAGQMVTTAASNLQENRPVLTALSERLDPLSIAGPYGQLTNEDPRAPLEGRWPHLFLYSRGRTIAAGTSEIQRGIIAQRVLDLPKDR